MWKNKEIRDKIAASRIGNKNAAGSVWSEEQRNAKRESMKGNTHLYGHRHSEDTRKKMSESAKNKPPRPPGSYRRSPETSAKQGETLTKYRVIADGAEFKNVPAAATAFGVTETTILKRCKSNSFPNFVRIPKR